MNFKKIAAKLAVIMVLGNIFAANFTVLAVDPPPGDGTVAKKREPRRKFTPEEDQRLTQLVGKYGPKSWSEVASEMGTRNARQCRERWKNYLSQEATNSKYTPEEDNIIRQKVSEIGPKYEKIAPFLNNKSASSVKNRCFKEVWKRIRESLPEKSPNGSNIGDDIASLTPVSMDQVGLAGKDSYGRSRTIRGDIDWSGYSFDAEQFDTRKSSNNYFVAFHGLLDYIALNSSLVQGNENSSQVLNLDEIEVGRTENININTPHSSMLPALIGAANSSIGNFTDVKFSKQAEGGFAAIRIKFKNILINPAAFAVELNTNTTPLWGGAPGTPNLLFLARNSDEPEKGWEVLDERVNVNDLLPTGFPWAAYFVRVSKRMYDEFMLAIPYEDNYSSSHVAISKFDVHAHKIQYKTKPTVPALDSGLPIGESGDGSSNLTCGFDGFGFDPFIDMSEFL